MPISRRTEAERTRNDAAELAKLRPHPEHQHNNEEQEYRQFSPPEGPDCTYSSEVTHLANYTKGLPHDEEFGLLLNPVDYKLFVTGIQSGKPQDFKNTPLGPGRLQNTSGTPSRQQIGTNTTGADRSNVWRSTIAKNGENGVTVRAWESAGAGNVFDLEGPDAQAVTMPPAPRLDSEELLAEVAEVYAMAKMRDHPFRDFPLPPGAGRIAEPIAEPERCVDLNDFEHAFGMLQDVPWFAGSDIGRLTPEEESRRRQLNNLYDLFRGQTPGENVGPYISQFLLLGNLSLDRNDRNCEEPVLNPSDGRIGYGAITIDQRVRIATPCKDYMTIWEQYIDVQNGADVRGLETYEEPRGEGYRFIATPRDLSTYVHYDALYEAYVNACISLLTDGVPFDRGIPFLEADIYDKQQGFAHFGGPHILTLVAEVATRALKAVRYQKFNVHRRLRPEAVGGRVDRWINSPGLSDGYGDPLFPLNPLMRGSFGAGLDDLQWAGSQFIREIIRNHNARNNSDHFSGSIGTGNRSYLLPMAFPEGSPMHPAYGAGHATVAGACVTILKAYFDHGWTPSSWIDNDGTVTGSAGTPIAYEAARDGSTLQPLRMDVPLTVEGELNKLCANISIGRNWAGVHYYTDYIESIRMGERIAIGLLEEQKLTYPENFSMTVPLFDGGAVRI